MRIVRACLSLLCLLAAASSVALAQGTGRARVLIVSGVAGDPQYADVFFKQATTMIDALKTRFGVPDSDIVYLAENPARDAARIKAASTKENVERELTALAERSKTGQAKSGRSQSGKNHTERCGECRSVRPIGTGCGPPRS